MRVHLMLLTAYAITGIDANTTSAKPTITEHLTSHSVDAAGIDANTATAKPSVTEHLTSHSLDAAVIDANTTTAKPTVTEHLTSHSLDAGKQTDLPTGHKMTSEAPGKQTDLPTGHKMTSEAPGKQADLPTGHKMTSEAHATIDAHTTLVKRNVTELLTHHGVHTGIHNTLPPEDHKKNTSETPVVTDSLSRPTMSYIPLGNNEMHITCFSKSGVLPIRYQLFLYDRMQQEKIALKSEPANFTMTMTPGKKVSLICTAISPSGEKSSNNVMLRVDDSTVAREDSEMDQKDSDSGHEHLIPPQYILTSVTREVQEYNKLVLITCSPILLVILVIVIVITYLRRQKEQRTAPESILIDSRIF